MELTEILDSEDRIVVDASIQGGNNFTGDIYESKRYSHLNVDLLKRQIRVIRQLKDILENPKTATISATTEELRDFEDVINNKRGYFSSHPPKKKKKTRIQRINERPQSQLTLLQTELYSTRRASYLKELRIEDNNYKLLLNMIKLIEPIIGIKKDRGFLLGFRDEDKSRNSDTAEKLTAALYWLSLFSCKSSCLITKDQDFEGLLSIITGLIGSDSFLPHNEFFRKRITENPFRLYEKVMGDFRLLIDSSLISYDTEFLIKESSKEVNEQAKKKIAGMWEEFNHSRKQVYRTALAHQYS